MRKDGETTSKLNPTRTRVRAPLLPQSGGCRVITKPHFRDHFVFMQQVAAGNGSGVARWPSAARRNAYKLAEVVLRMKQTSFFRTPG